MNKLFKALIYDKQVSLSVLDTTDLVNKAIKIHNLSGQSARLLGNLLTVCAYMSGCLKSDKGAVSITVKSPDSSGSASVSGDVNLHIRGYVDGSCKTSLAGGTVTVIKDDGFYRPFTGACELISDDVSENMEHYFDLSEQIPTKVRVGAKFDGEKCLAAGGVVLQLLPGHTDEVKKFAEEKFAEIADVAEDIRTLGAEGLIKKYFSQQTAGVHMYITEPQYKCNCSRGKIATLLLSVGKSELENILKEQGEVSVHCHYCNTDYKYLKEDIDKLFK